METLDRQVRNFRRRAALTSALAIGVRLLALWLLVWGTAVLALRAGFDLPRSDLLWGAAGALPLAIAALVLGFRRRPQPSSVLSLLDRNNAGGGLMMAEGEVEIGAWREAIGDVRAPRIRGRYPWRLLATGSAFVAAAFLMPVAPVGLEAERPLEIGEEIAQLAERIEVLEEEGLLEEEQAERFEAGLESLEAEASGQDPAATWEALDHLQEMTDRTAAEVAEAALAEGERLAAAEAVAEALSVGTDAATEHLAGEAMADLAALTARAAADSKLLDSTQLAELRAAAGAGEAPGKRRAGGAPGKQLDLGQLLDALGRGKGSLAEKLDRLYAGGLIDLETLLAAKRGLEGGDLGELAAFLDGNGLEAASGYCRGAGRGGISRGRGDAPMTWKDPSSPDGAGWREQILDPASLAALHQSHLLGLTAADPNALEPVAPGAAGGGLDPAATAGGGGAYTHTLLPRHRGAVKRYFDRQAAGESPENRDR